jgi:hypothetical protein
LKNFGLVVLKKNQGSMQKRNPKGSTMIKPSLTRFKNFRNKRKFGSRRKPNQEKDILKVQCLNCQKYGHYKNQCPELKKRKDKHEASIAEEKEPTKKTKQNGRDFFF